MAAKDNEKTEEIERKPPKGGRVGGTIFPRLSLEDALGFAQTLARKTMSGPQPAETVLIGVFKNKGAVGGVKASALKQFGLLDGMAKTGGYEATSLARGIDAATPEERPALWRRAFLSSKIFAQIYETLQGDTVTKARIRQVAMTNGVHGSNADLCVDRFVAGAIKAGLAANAPDDKIALLARGVEPIVVDPAGEEEEHEPPGEESKEIPTLPATSPKSPAAPAARPPANPDGPGTHTGAQLQLHVDSSSDPDKLRKQLELLREFGMI